MATAQLNRITRYIRQSLTAQAFGEATDAVLLERFTAQHDEAAFAALVRRHGPMVLCVCRRVVQNLPDAEDAFQAAFLLLARKAGSIRQGESLPGWLFAVARRLALRVRVGVNRRHAFETQVKAMAPTESTVDLPEMDAEQRVLLDEELARLPEKYRTALVVCYLEGKTRAEAARHLGWKPGAVKIRLERGRELLRSRLTRRGLALSAGALATVLAEAGQASAVAPALIESTVQAAMVLGAGQAVLAGLVSEQTLALVEGMRKTMLLTKLKIATAVVLALSALGSGTSWLLHPRAVAQAPAAAEPAPPTAGEKSPAKDLYGEPLPPGARARLGTLHFRHESNVTFVAYTPDGKYLITGTQEGIIRKWDAVTGKELLQFSKPNAVPQLGKGNAAVMQLQMAQFQVRGGRTTLALAPDGTTLAMAGQGNAPTLISLWDVATGKKIREWNAPNPIFGLTFAPDSKQLLSRGQDSMLRLWDVAEGKEIRAFGEQPKPQQAGGAFVFIGGNNGRVVFSSDGKTVLTQAMERDQQQFTTAVKRWEVATGKELPPVKGTQGAFESVTFASDGKTTVWVAANPVKARLFDLEAGKELREIEDAHSILAFSMDGNLLVGRTEGQALAIWDTTAGKLKHKLTAGSEPVGNGQFVIISYGGSGNGTTVFSTDSKRLAAADGTVVRQWEVASGKEIAQTGGHTAAVSQVAFAPDGKGIFSRGADHTLRMWDASGRETQRLELPAAANAAFSADGQLLVLASRGTIRVWDTKAGKEIRQWKGHEKGIGGLTISADGSLIATRSPDHTIRIWETASGKELKQIAEPGNGGNMNAIGGFIAVGAFNSDGLGLVFSPDGAILATLPSLNRRGLRIVINGQAAPQQPTEQEPIRLWDVATGKLVRKFAVPKSEIVSARFSPDGRTLATANSDGTVSLYEVITGKERFQIKSGQAAVLCFSPDGKVLVTGGGTGAIGFWDIATGKEMAQRKGHQAGIASLAVADDGKTLLSGSSDTTALLWDIPVLDLPKAAPANLETAQLDSLWKDLAGDDSAKAHDAIRTLSAAPGQTMTFLRERLKPVPVPDPQRIAKLIADLDNRQFAVRQKAEEELERLGELVEPILKQILAGQPSLETRQRVEKLREKIVTVQVPSADTLQAVRSLIAVEDIGTAEARQLLEKLSQGAPGALQTREAKAAHHRLLKRSASAAK